MRKFVKIKRYDDLIFKMSKYNRTEPMTFTGRVKVHGSNAGISLSDDGGLVCQSRTKLLDKDVTLSGFWGFVKDRESTLLKYVKPNTVLFGEWCGAGVQKQLGVSKLPKMLILYEILGFDGVYRGISSLMHPNIIKTLNELNVYVIDQFKTYNVTIDPRNQESAKEYINDAVKVVEKSCPVCEYFGVSGRGEGLVWGNEDFTYKFKSISNSPKSYINVFERELFKKRMELLNAIAKDWLPDEVLDKYLSKLMHDTIPKKNNTGNYVRQVINDVLDEHASEVEGLEVTNKSLGIALSKVVSRHYLRACASGEIITTNHNP